MKCCMVLKKHVDLSSYLSIISVPLQQQKYKPFGDILLSFPEHETVTDYRRELDISRAICRTSYIAGDIPFTRVYSKLS